MRTLTALLALALLAAACGSDSDDETAPEETTAVTSTTDAPTTTAVTTTAAPTTIAAPTTVAPTTTAPLTTEPGPTTTTPSHSDDLEAVELIGDGPYTVGSFNILLDGTENGRPLAVQVWFPLADGVSAEPMSYTFITGDSYPSPRALDITADDSNTSADGPFPLVVYSHGSGGLRFIHSDYTEVLASHGHVVVAPDHVGNTAVEQFLGSEDDRDTVAFNRVSDITWVLDTVLSGDRGLGPIQAIVDPERIAVTGHSFGGFTSYGIASGFENAVGTVPADDRVKAIIPLAPAVGARTGPTLLTDEMLARIEIPALVIAGTDDGTTPVEPNVNRAWELTNSSPHYRLELIAADHQSFTDVCDYQDAFEAGLEVTAVVRGIIDEFAAAGCQEGQMPIQRVQDLTNTFVLRFLDSVFGEGEMIDPAVSSAGADTIYRAK